MRMIAASGRVYKSGPPLNPLLGRDLRRKNTRRFRFDGSANDKSSALACRRSCRDAAGHADITKRNYAAGPKRFESAPPKWSDEGHVHERVADIAPLSPATMERSVICAG